MGKRLAVIASLALAASVVAFVFAGTFDGRYPFGSDERPMCSGTPDGIPAGCRYGPLGNHWFEPFLWPAIITFVLVLAIGLTLARRLDLREPDEPI